MGIEHQSKGQAWQEADRLGCKLSLAIHCPVTLDYDKPVFNCHHNIHFIKWCVIEWVPEELLKYHEENQKCQRQSAI